MAAPTRTAEGLKLISWALLLSFFATLIGAAGSAILVAVSPSDASSLVLGVGVAVGIAAGLLALVLVVFFLVGYFTLYPHRRELGPTHEKNVERSLLLFIGIIVAYVVVVAVIAIMFILALADFILPFGPMTPPFQPTPEELLQALLPALLVAQGLDILVAILLALLLYVLVVAILPSRQQSRLKYTMVLYVLGPAAGFATFVVLFLTGQLSFPAFVEGTSPFVFPAFSFQLQDALAGLVRSSLQAIAIFLFWGTYRAAHDAARGGVTRLNGE
ncbi:MAG: hypothetical protein V3U17_01935 [Thermoplasmata archaeon]